MNPNTQDADRCGGSSLMLTNVFGMASNSVIQVASRLGVLLIFASLVSFLAIRLAMSLVSSSKVKARKQWMSSLLRARMDH